MAAGPSGVYFYYSELGEIVGQVLCITVRSSWRGREDEVDGVVGEGVDASVSGRHDRHVGGDGRRRQASEKEKLEPWGKASLSISTNLRL